MIYVGSQNATQNGVTNKVEVYQTSRFGSKSPTSFYYKFQARLITPYEIKKRGWSGITIDILFKATYTNKDMANMFMKRNYLLEKIKATQNWISKPILIPIVYK